MVIPEKLSSLKADELRDECDKRDIAHEGLTREQLKAEILQYEKHKQLAVVRNNSMMFGKVNETSKCVSWQSVSVRLSLNMYIE